MPDSLTVRVPATSANMGPGFDCLGLALDFWNEVRVDLGGSGLQVTGEGEGSLSLGKHNLVHEGISLAFAEAGQPMPRIGVRCHNEIPLGRGLGSSSAAVVGGLVAGNELCGRPLSQDRLLELAAQTEGHPDNSAAALLGGCQIVVQDGDRLVTATVPVPEGLRAVLFIPDMPMPTEHARGLLPPIVDRSDAVFNTGRTALLVSAFFSGDLSKLRVATQDRLHQPARETIFPAMKNIIKSALDAGALGVFLSGAGSTVLALATDRELTIGYEMADAAAKSGIDGTLKVTRPTTTGAHVAAS
ncbi:MAG: homoserine kinase [Chloroflexi bacterium]|nr:homoserine kinase [Chloroflexota bacterium]